MASDKALSAAEKRQIDRVAESRLDAFKQSLNQFLGPVAEPVYIGATDGLSGLGGMGLDVTSRYITKSLATTKDGEQPGLAAKYPEYFSGALSMGLGVPAYMVNLLVPGSKLTPFRQGVRVGTATLTTLGLNRVLSKWLKLPMA